MDQVEQKNKTPFIFTDLLRAKSKGILEPPAAFLNRLGLMPNTVTILGLVGNVVAAVLLALGHIQWGGLVVLLMGPIDALDGTMARLRGQPTDFGAFVDSVTDRYSELFILGGLLVYYLQRQDPLACALVYLAAAGSVLVSYVKSRGETVGFNVKVGLLTRVERFLVTAVGLLINQPLIMVAIIAVLANFTAVQRIVHVRKQFYARGTGESKK